LPQGLIALGPHPFESKKVWQKILNGEDDCFNFFKQFWIFTSKPVKYRDFSAKTKTEFHTLSPTTCLCDATSKNANSAFQKLL
jgi:hypothetical protein